MTKFSDNLFKTIQEGSTSLYSDMVRVCRENLPRDANDRYQRLRKEDYVARDEADIAVYVHRVADRHHSKFLWLYDNLFQRYPSVFQGELDLVVWGCGCGLDLLALYDRAMKQNNPQLWLVVRSVTLLDKSEVALSCAKEIAELLFPCARNRIFGYVCDLRNYDPEKIRIPHSFIYTPRLHLISNVLDLLSQEQLAVFVAKQKRCTARKSYFNEMFVAFSPEYKNWDSAGSGQKLEAFRTAWGAKATEVSVSGCEPENCAYATFEYNDCRISDAYKMYASGNTCLQNLVRGRNRCIDEGCDDSNLAYLHSKLATIDIGGLNFFECYEWVDVQKYEKIQGGAVIDRILFVPQKGSAVAPCVIWVGWHSQNAPDPKVLAWKSLLKTNGLDESDWDGYAEKTKVLNWDCNNRQISGDTDFSDYMTDARVDFSEAFIIDPRGVKPLPSLDKAMDKKQREIILGRQQLRRIRGGAGCGKTTTMLWHGVMSVLRMHLPVLMACRTVTLFSHNQRRMAATILNQVPGLEYVERDLIRFKTIDKYLCEHIDAINGCRIRHCGKCKRRFHDNMNQNNDRTLEECVPAVCKEGNPVMPDCEVIVNYGESPDVVGRNLTGWEKDALCNGCKEKYIRALCDKEPYALINAGGFGAVMVDEIQSVSPDMVQALYNLTEAGNLRREFYCFCDERQCLKPKALEPDEAIQKLRVKTPKGTLGRAFRGGWVSLNKPYRQVGEMSGTLTEVAREFQKLTDNKYGGNETEWAPYRPSLLTTAFAVERFEKDCSTWMVLENAVIEAINRMEQQEDGKITVVCDATETVRKLLLATEGINWISTHAKQESFKEEQRLRNSFEETEDRIGLTTIELVQGWDLENVILVITKDLSNYGQEIESVTTGITRAKQRLRIIDASPSGWVYEQLKRFN